MVLPAVNRGLFTLVLAQHRPQTNFGLICNEFARGPRRVRVRYIVT